MCIDNFVTVFLRNHHLLLKIAAKDNEFNHVTYVFMNSFFYHTIFLCKYRFRIEVINSTANLAVKLEIAVLI